MRNMEIYFANLILVSNNYFLLMVRDSNYKNLDFGHRYYDLPGGRVENNETLLASLRRELYEETSIDLDKVNDLNLFCNYSLEFPEFTRFNYYYIGFIHSKCEIHLSSEHIDFFWADFNRLENFDKMLSTHKSALMEYKTLY